MLPLLVTTLLGTYDATIIVIYGIAASAVAWAVETTISQIAVDLGISLSPAAKAFLFIALVEELVKFGAIVAAIKPHSSPKRIIVDGVLCAIGFASAENFLYVVAFKESMNEVYSLFAFSMTRLLAPFIMHLSGAPILVVGLCFKQFNPSAGIGLAVLYHGAYDALIAKASPSAFRMAYALVILGCITSGFIFKRCNAFGSHFK